MSEMDKEIIIDGVDVAGCCCYENVKCLWTKRYYENNIVPDCEKVKDCYYKQRQQLKAKNIELKRELRFVEKDRAWIKERCIDAGKELGKHSFAWDGKEKNLVVQAMELNEMYEKLKEENEKLLHQKNTMSARYAITYTTLQEIKAITKGKSILTYEIKDILDLIAKTESEG